MGRKGGKYRKKDSTIPNARPVGYDDDEDMMNDEIDAFHKRRDIVPLDINEDEAESDEDIEHPVFGLEDDDDKGDNGDDDDDLFEDASQLTGLAAKIARQQKFLRAKIGGVEEEMDDGDDDDEEEEDRAVWGRSKNSYYNADNIDYEIQSSDEELPAEEEAEALRLQKEKAKSLTAEDFGLENISQSESDKEPTFEEILVRGRSLSKANLSKEAEDETTAYEEVKKDLNDLTREEQMDVVYSLAPELVGLLSELGDTMEHLENKVNPLLNKIRDAENVNKGGTQYMEMKQQLLLSYSQAITFYLLLKSEGQPVRDHPVISRLVELKNLLDKMRELDENLPSQLEDILQKNGSDERVGKQVEECATIKSFSVTEAHHSSVAPVEIPEKSEALEGSKVVNENPLKGYKLKKSKLKQQDTEVGTQSMQMLKVRAALEEKLRQKGILTSIEKTNNGAQKRLRPMNGQLETLDDFDDDAMDLDKVNHRTGISNGSTLHAHKLPKVVTQGNKPKIVSGDDDLPKRDDIGERHRKHELRVLAGAGINSVIDADDISKTLHSEDDSDIDLDDQTESDLEFYKQIEEENSVKVAAKSEMYSRSTKVLPMPETHLDGKRQITHQMEKNRGLTRARKKLTKNPRKKYKLKHQKATVRRKGQVREIRKPTGPYGGEVSGINATISRSIRFKS